MSRGVWAAGALVAAVGLVAAGCTASPGSSSSTPSAPSSVASPASAASVASPASASVPATGATSGPATSSSSPSSAASATSAPAVSPTSGGGGGGDAGCATQSLQAKAGLAQGALGSVYQIIDFTNISSAACTLFGYPGVALAAGTPAVQVGAAATRSTAAPASLVTLEPGQTANALLRITQASDYSVSVCSPTPTTYLQIYPPNQTAPIYLPYTSTGCASTTVNLLSIGVVQAGSGG